MAGETGDVTSTLTALERKLRELERELSTMGPARQPAPAAPSAGRPPFAPAPGAPAPPPATPALLGDAQRRIGDLQGQLEELVRFRDELAEAAGALVAEYSRALGRLSGADPAALEGDVAIDAGPFADIATLALFEHALRRVPQAEHVHVRSFDEGRAQIDVRLSGPVRLADELERSAPAPFRVDEAAPGRLKLTFEG